MRRSTASDYLIAASGTAGVPAGRPGRVPPPRDSCSLEIKFDLGEVEFDSMAIKIDLRKIKIDSMEVKFDSVEVKIDSMEVDFDSMEIKIDSMAIEVDLREVKIDSMAIENDVLEIEWASGNRKTASGGETRRSAGGNGSCGRTPRAAAAALPSSF